MTWQAVDLLDRDGGVARDRASCARRRLPLRRRGARRAVVGSDRSDVRRQRPRHAPPARGAAAAGSRGTRAASELGAGLRGRGRAAHRRPPARAPQPVRAEQARAGAGRASMRRRRPARHDRARVQPLRSAPGSRASPRPGSRAGLPRSRPAAAAAEIAVGNLDARRDLTDVRDTVRAYRRSLERGDSRPRLQRLLGPRDRDPRPARDAARARARADSRQRRSGALPSQRRAAAARRSDPHPRRARLDADDSARADARRPARATGAAQIESSAERYDMRDTRAGASSRRTKGEHARHVQLLFDLGARRQPDHTRDIADTVKRRRHRGADRGGAARRRGALSGGDLPLGAQPRRRACRSTGRSIRIAAARTAATTASRAATTCSSR